jgi:hypothetical protein
MRAAPFAIPAEMQALRLELPELWGIRPRAGIAWIG